MYVHASFDIPRIVKHCCRCPSPPLAVRSDDLSMRWKARWHMQANMLPLFMFSFLVSRPPRPHHHLSCSHLFRLSCFNPIEVLYFRLLLSSLNPPSPPHRTHLSAMSRPFVHSVARKERPHACRTFWKGTGQASIPTHDCISSTKNRQGKTLMLFYHCLHSLF